LYIIYNQIYPFVLHKCQYLFIVIFLTPASFVVRSEERMLWKQVMTASKRGDMTSELKGS